MKVYTKVRISIETEEVIEEESFEYEGSVALCGGGGASGQLSFPKPDNSSSYPTTANDLYTEWLGRVDDKIDAAITAGSSPFDRKTAVDASGYLDDAGSNAESAASEASSFNASTSWLTYVENAKGKVQDEDYFLSNLITTILSKVADDVSDQFETAASVTESQVETIMTNAYNKAVTDMQSLVTAAFNKASDLAGGDEVDDAVEAFDENSRKELFSAQSRLAASMVDIGAVNSSAFFMGMALLERDHVRQVNAYRAQLELKSVTEFFNAFIQGYLNEYTAYINAGMSVHKALMTAFSMYLTSSDNAKRLAMGSAGQILQGVLGEKRLKSMAAATEAEVGRIRYLAEQQEYDKNIAYDVKDATWILDFIQSGANVLASAGGATMVPGHMSKEQSTISGALSGAAMGAEVGAQSGNPYVIGGATIIGAIAGGYLGNQGY